ncbi:MAG: hypothetical protein AAF391_02300 [Bacteroidota bacterium]
MKRYLLHTRNINNSLVFYRALFNRMPDELDGWRMKYFLPKLQVEIVEDEIPPKEGGIQSLEVKVYDQLAALNKRMKRFRSVVNWKEDCKRLGDAFGLLDPDGNKWIIGNPQTEVHFEKCYVK